MKKIVKLVFPFIFLLTVVGFEVTRDLTIFFKSKIAISTILTELIEEDNCKKDGKTGASSIFELDADIVNFRTTSLLRESVKTSVICACDLNYKRLEQKVLLPPPKLFS